MRLSGLQKEVLALYRQCLRESRKKPQVCECHDDTCVQETQWLTRRQATRSHFEHFAR